MTTWSDPVTDGNTTRYDGIDGAYTLHKWIWRTGNGTTTWDADAAGATTVEYLVVAGGGAGGAGSYGGGGGAGGLRENSATKDFTVSGSLTVTVGTGGDASNGSASVFSTIAASGGGKGASSAGNGGSGGGAQYNDPTAHGTGNVGGYTPVEGYAGGHAVDGDPNYPAGGGGGASQVGFDAPNGTNGGAGGNGIASSITGSSVTYAGGGGGASYAGSAGTGGLGGGGAGSIYGGGLGTDGTANTGGGGGGTGSPSIGSSKGGPGIVIIKYPTPGAADNYSGIGMGSANMIAAGV